MPLPAIVGSILTNKYVIGLIAALALIIYIQHLRHSVESLKTENSALETQVETQKKTIENIKKDVEAVSKAKEDVLAERERLDKKKKELEETIYRENKKKKSLEELALKKTTLIQKKVNAATKQVFECFELISKGGDC